MSESTLRMPAAAKLPKRTRAQWDELIRERETLDAQRKAHNREADALAKTICEIDRELVAFLEGETAGKPEQQLTLKNFILSFVWKKPIAITLAFAAYRKLSKPEKVEIAAEVGDKRCLEIQWRNAPPAASAAAA